MKRFITLLLLPWLCGIAAADDAAGATAVVAKKKAFLDSIVIPRVDLKDNSIEEAVDLAWARTIELDGSELDPRLRGVTISLRKEPGLPPNAYGRTLNYQARNIRLSHLLIEIAKQGRLDLYTTTIGVVFCPPGLSPCPTRWGAKGEIWETLYKAPRRSPDDDKPEK